MVKKVTPKTTELLTKEYFEKTIKSALGDTQRGLETSLENTLDRKLNMRFLEFGTTLDRRLDNRFKEFEITSNRRFEERLDKRLDILETNLLRMIDTKLEEKLTLFRKEVYDKFDWLFNKIKKFDEEHIFHSSRIYGHEDQLQNHEVRIGVLEKKSI